MRTSVALALLLALGSTACGAAAPTGVLVRFADDTPEADVQVRCGGKPDPTSANLAQTNAYGDCLRSTGGRLTNAVAPFVGKTLTCNYAEATAFGDYQEKNIATTVAYPGGLSKDAIELDYGHSVSGSDRLVFGGLWARREASPDHVRYHVDVGDAVLGGYCDGSTVYGLEESVAVYAATLVFRSDWTCARVAPKHYFTELRCTTAS